MDLTLHIPFQTPPAADLLTRTCRILSEVQIDIRERYQYSVDQSVSTCVNDDDDI